jgi:small subunit ribosomal protein S17e
MNRIKRISTELLQKYPEKFGPQFDANKKALNDLAVVRSKVLRNELAGYITAHLRRLELQQKASMTATAEETDEQESEEEAEE